MLPQVFTLPPVAAYQHRLVFDLYPAQPLDPLEALIAERLADNAARPAAAAPPPPVLLPPHAAATRRQPITTRWAPDCPAIGKTPPAAAPAPRQAWRQKTPARNGRHPPPRPRSAPRNKTDRLIIVALDPGHGGEDPGAIGPGGTREKDVVLQIAHRLRDRINQQPATMRAFLTRDADFFVPLHVRVQKAQQRARPTCSSACMPTPSSPPRPRAPASLR